MKDFILILLAIIAIIFFGCGSDNHKLDEELLAPELHNRIGYSMEQIKFWHSQDKPMFTTYSLQTESDSELVYVNKEWNELKIDYQFRDNTVYQTGISYVTNGAKSTMSMVKSQMEILNEFGFTIVVEKDIAKDKLLGYVIRSNETIPNLRAKYFIGELPGTEVFHRVSYYYEGQK